MMRAALLATLACAAVLAAAFLGAAAPAWRPVGELDGLRAQDPRAGAESQETAVDWPMAGRDGARTGYTESPAPLNMTPVWTASLGTSEIRTPVVSGGTVYVACGGGRILALAADTGELAWEQRFSSGISGSPALGAGTLFVSLESGSVRALDPATSAERWNVTLGGAPTSPLPAGSSVYLGYSYNGGKNGTLCSLNATTGALTWKLQAPTGISSELSCGGGRVYAGCQDGTLFSATSAGSGPWQITLSAGSPVTGAAAVSGGRVFASAGMQVYAADAATGAIAWKNTTGGACEGSPAAAHGKAYFSSSDGRLYAFGAATGSLEWKREPAGGLKASPIVCGDTVVACALDSVAYTYGANSSEPGKTFQAGGGINAAPSAAGGRLYVASADHVLYCIGEGPAALVADDSGIPSDLVGGQEAKVRVLVYDSTTRVPVAQASVSLSSSGGGFFDPSYYGATDSGGEFSTTLVPPNIDGYTRLQMYASHSAYGPCWAYVGAGIRYQPALTGLLSVSPALVPSSGKAAIVLSFGEGGNSSGATVTFSAAHGAVLPASLYIDSIRPNVTAEYTAPLTGSKVTDTIVAKLEKPGYLPATLSVSAEVIPRLIARMALSSSRMPAGCPVNISVVVEDDLRAPVRDAKVAIASQECVVTPQVGFTDGGGRLTAQATAAGANEGGQAPFSAEVTKEGYYPAQSGASAEVGSSKAKALAMCVFSRDGALPGYAGTEIGVMVRDANTGAAVDGAAVSFAVSDYAGKVGPASRIGPGSYSAAFTAFSVARNTTVSVTAYASKPGYLGASGAALVRILSIVPRLQVFASAPAPALSPGQPPAEISAVVQDPSGDYASGASLAFASEPAGALSASASEDLSLPGRFIVRVQAMPAAAPGPCALVVTARKDGYSQGELSLQFTIAQEGMTRLICTISGIGQAAVSGRITLQGTAGYGGQAAPAGAAAVAAVQYQLGRDYAFSEAAWKNATGTGQWAAQVDTAALENGIYRVYARAWNGTDYSEIAHADILVNNPQPQEMTVYAKALAAGAGAVIAGSAAAALAISRGGRKKKDEGDIGDDSLPWGAESPGTGGKS